MSELLVAINFGRREHFPVGYPKGKYSFCQTFVIGSLELSLLRGEQFTAFVPNESTSLSSCQEKEIASLRSKHFEKNDHKLLVGESTFLRSFQLIYIHFCQIYAIGCHELTSLVPEENTSLCSIQKR